MRYLLLDTAYRVQQVLPDHRVVVENQASGGQVLVTAEELVAAWTADLLSFQVQTPAAGDQHGPPLAEPDATDLQSCTAARQEEAWRRDRLLQPVLACHASERTGDTLAAYVAALRADGVMRMSPRSVQPWLRDRGPRADRGQLRACVLDVALGLSPAPAESTLGLIACV
jgi:hypothetical protein